MTSALRTVARDWLPPRLTRAYRQWRGQSIGFGGDYADWARAQQASRGYDDTQIVEHVRQAMAQALQTPGAVERDGVVLTESEINFPQLAALQYAALALGRLRVLDFGGALGGAYFQMRALLPPELPLQWTVIEQPGFVECGTRHFANAQLGFKASFEEAAAEGGGDLVLLSSVLPYLERPRRALDQVQEAGCEFILLDRTPVLPGAVRDRLTVQQVAMPEYSASYPAWFFAEQPLWDAFMPRYRRVFGFDSFESWELDGLKSRSIGALFRKGGP